MKEIAYVTVAFVNSGEKLSKKNYVYSIMNENILKKIEGLMDYSFYINASDLKTPYDNPIVIINITKKGTSLFEEIKNATPLTRSIIQIYDDNIKSFPAYLCLSRRVTYTQKIQAKIKTKDDFKESFIDNFNDGSIKEMNMLNNILSIDDYGRVFDIKFSIYGPAFRTEDNKYLSYDKIKQSWIDVTGMVFGDFPFAYAFPVSTKMVKKNDFIKHNDNWVRVVESDYSKKILKVEDINVKEYKNVIPTVNVFGFNFYTKLVFFEFDGIIPDEDNPFGKMLPFLMLSNEGKDTKDLLPLMLMMSGSSKGAMEINNPLMMMLLMRNNNNDNNDLFSMMMLSSFMNEKTNPFNNLCQ